MAAGTLGFLKDVELPYVNSFVEELIAFCNQKHQDVMHEITTKQVVSDELDAKIKKAIEEFKATKKA